MRRLAARVCLLPLLLLPLLLPLLLLRCAGSLITDEQRVLASLFNGYLPSTPPRANDSGPINIEVSFRLNQIIDLDERNQILSTNVFIEQRWNDSKLSWASFGFSADAKLRISATKVWLPDTFIFNNADSRKSGFLRSVYVLLQPDGQVSWPVPDKLRTACQVNIANFPFDRQRCSIRLGSWVHSSRQLAFVPRDLAAVDQQDYTDNSEWLLLSAVPSLQLRRLNSSGHFGGRPQALLDSQEFSDLVIDLVIQRRSFFYVWNIVLPCVMLSVLTLVSFRVPPDNCEKISMGLSVFLAFSMFMLLVAEQVPATSESVPLIGLYITVLMSMTSISVIFSVCIVNLNHRGSKFRPPHRLLKLIFITWLGKLLRVSTSVRQAVKQFEVAHRLEYRKTADEYQHRMASLRRQIDFLRDCLRLQRLEAELNDLWLQQQDPLTRWLGASPGRRERLRRFQSDCDDLPYLDASEESPQSRAAGAPHDDDDDEDFAEVADNPEVEPGAGRNFYGDGGDVVAAEWKLIALAVDKVFFCLFLLGTLCVYVYLFAIFPAMNSQ